MRERFIQLVLIIGIATTQLPAMAGEGGVGAGNGGNGAREEYLQRLRRDYGRISMGARNQMDDIAAWCSRAGRVLQRELTRASRLIERGAVEQASFTLVDALQAARDSMDVDTERGGPMTGELIQRGLDYAAALDQVACTMGTSSCGTDPLLAATKFDFLSEYVSFIIKTEREVDQPWYIPYRYQYYASCRQRCYDDGARNVDGERYPDPLAYDSCWSDCAPQFKYREFQKTYVEFARKQLEFFTKNFTDIVDRRGGSVVVPIGNPKVFLKLMELAAGYVAWDLRSNVFAYANTCAITDLEQLVGELSAYNMGDRMYWMNDRQAISDVRSRLDAVLDSMQSCGARYTK